MMENSDTLLLKEVDASSRPAPDGGENVKCLDGPDCHMLLVKGATLGAGSYSVYCSLHGWWEYSFAISSGKDPEIEFQSAQKDFEKLVAVWQTIDSKANPTPELQSAKFAFMEKYF